MGKLITDEMVDTLAVSGTPDDVAAEIVRRYGGHADRVSVYFPGYEAADDLVADVTAALKATSPTGAAA
jgi:alkanesulfonate monooxygenase SsuD/methylene tetrahydromethanopterin reductase-like flavin-dependent oxidoreductase (luciferase family)